MDDDLTAADYTVLIEAVNAWIDRGTAGELVSLIGAMALPPNERPKWEAEHKAKKAAGKFSAAQECETAILITAKLIKKRRALMPYSPNGRSGDEQTPDSS